MAWTAAVRRRAGPVVPTVLAMAAVAVAQAWTTRTARTISIVADEAGYLANARYLAGVGEAWNMGTTTFYRPGYSLLLVPLYRLFDDPATVYRAAVVVNIALAAATVPLAAAVARRLFGLRRGTALAVGTVATLYPPTFLQSNFAWSENLFVPLFLGLALATHALLVDRRWWTGPLVGLLAPLLVLTHGRGAGPAAVAVVVVAVAGARGVVDRRAAAVGIGLAAAGLLAGQALNRHLVDVLFERDRGDERLVRDALGRIDDLGAVVLAVGGQVWYLLVATAGLAGVGAVALVLRARSPGRAGEAGAAWAALAMVGSVLVVSSLYMADRPRADHAIYGRYDEGVILLLLVAGLAHLVSAEARRRVVATAGAGAALVVAGAVLWGWRQDLLLEAPFNAVNALGVRPWREAFDGLRLVPITLVALALLALVLGASFVRRRGALAVTAVLAVVAVAHLHATFATGKTRSIVGAEQAEVVDHLVGSDAVLAYARTPGVDARFWAYQQYLPEQRFTRFRADLGADPGSDLVWAPTSPTSPVRPLLAESRIAYLDPWYPVALHVLPGARQQAMAAAGQLLPAGWPAALPAEQSRGRIELVGGGGSVDGGRLRAELRLRHDGGPPWPAVQALPDPTGAVRVAVRLVDDACDCQVAERRVDLPRMLYAGDAVDLEVDVAVDLPDDRPSGRSYRVRYELIQENIGPLPVQAAAEL